MTGNEEYFEAPIDSKTKCISYILLIFVLFFVLFLFTAMTVLLWSFVTVILWLILVIFISGIFTYYFLFKPNGYSITDTELLVRRRLPDKRIPFTEIQKILYLKKVEFSKVSRTNTRHSGYGESRFIHFRDVHIRGFGVVHSYCTRLHDFVIISTRHYKPFLLSPDDPNRFIKALRNQMRSSGYRLYLCKNRKGFFRPMK